MSCIQKMLDYGLSEKDLAIVIFDRAKIYEGDVAQEVCHMYVLR